MTFLLVGKHDISTGCRQLSKTFEDWGGIESLSDPDCVPILNGGLALCGKTDVLVEPGCCADLLDVNNWAEVATYRKAEWQMLWIGHPWISFRFQAPWVILSDRHESDAPRERWAVSPDEIRRALSETHMELKAFSMQIARVLPTLGFSGDPILMANRLTGLTEIAR